MAYRKTSEVCSRKCPFLKITPTKSGVIPYRCVLFDSYLVFNGAILRCSNCLGGHHKSTKEEGLELIGSIQGDLRKVQKKHFFQKMPALYQKTFVDYLRLFGKSIPLPQSVEKMGSIHINPLKNSMFFPLPKEKKESTRTTLDREDIHRLLMSKKETVSSHVDNKTMRLIENLFLVLDASEKSMMKSIISNPNAFETFLKKLKTMSRNDSLLKNVRHEIDQIYTQQEQIYQNLYIKEMGNRSR